MRNTVIEYLNEINLEGFQNLVLKEDSGRPHLLTSIISNFHKNMSAVQDLEHETEINKLKEGIKVLDMTHKNIVKTMSDRNKTHCSSQIGQFGFMVKNLLKD